ncbi:exported hypothetical protein [uncultured Pleomorphomonas sp.]|uniref:Uncharacterized protein n=1 Tax=uncultured Pleomorphomonas sp. TaxID=442121 RepID=A0A212LPJ8_9HYPH|nr:exported hypothetical protein [uncultured Pleomorphomonas sp.]
MRQQKTRSSTRARRDARRSRISTTGLAPGRASATLRLSPSCVPLHRVFDRAVPSRPNRSRTRNALARPNITFPPATIIFRLRIYMIPVDPA